MDWYGSPEYVPLYRFPNGIYVMLLESSQGNPTELRIIVINFSLNPLQHLTIPRNLTYFSLLSAMG